MRLIDADALEYHEIDEIGGEYNPYLGCSKAYIDRQPTIEPCQVGKWEFHCQHWSKCSICGYADKFADKWNYCPNCGAKMENVEKSLIDIKTET